MDNQKNQGHDPATIQLLEALYKNVKMGADSIIDLMPKVSDKAMREELTCELEKYEGFAKEAKDMLADLGVKPADEGIFAKLGTKMSVAMNTLIDSTPSHIAEMMIQGGTMGITDATKLLREHENTSCSEEALALARKIIKFEEDTVEKLKKYL